MAPALNDTPQSGALKADYAAPASTKEFRHPLPPAAGLNTKEKTQYLSMLRESVVKLQEEINVFLTSKMEEDKITATNGGKKVDEKEEEDNYGEEKVDEDA